MGSSGRTRVYLTVDVECAEERVFGRTVQPPLGYDLRFWGRLANQREQLGLPLLVQALARADLRATFVEPLAAGHFGERGLADACAYLLAAGQDVQLHLHPTQRRVDWHSRGEGKLPDDMAAYSVDEQTALLQAGLAGLARAGVPRASLVGFRAGNFGADENTWAAMARVGLTVSSNFNLCWQQRNCRIPRRRGADNRLYETGRPGVWELPISNFADGWGFRHLQISAVSFPETRHFLLEARRLGLAEVTLVTHSFEFFTVDSIPGRLGRPNPINIERLRRLLEFLRARPDEFDVDTIGALGQRLRAGGGPSAMVTALPQTRMDLRLGRVMEQVAKRLSASLPLPV